MNKNQNTFDPKNFMMLIAVLFWAGAFIAAKFSVLEFDTFTLIFLRFLMAAIIILPITIKFDKNWKMTKKEFPFLLLLSVIGMFGYHLFFFLAVKYTTATNSALIVAMTPTLTAVLSALILFEKLKVKHVISLLLSLFGVILIITKGHLLILSTIKVNKGDLIMLLGVVCWAVYAILSKKALNKMSAYKLTFYAFLFCSIEAIPLMLIFESPFAAMSSASSNAWLSVIYMAIFPSVFGYLINQLSIKRIGPSKTTIFMNLTPLVSMVLASIMLNEKITIVSLLAAAFIISGILLSTLNTKSSS